MKILSSALFVITSYTSNGRNWVSKTIGRGFNFRNACVRPPRTKRALIITENEIVIMLIAGSVLKKNVKMCFAPWNSSLYTLERI